MAGVRVLVFSSSGSGSRRSKVDTHILQNAAGHREWLNLSINSNPGGWFTTAHALLAILRMCNVKISWLQGKNLSVEIGIGGTSSSTSSGGRNSSSLRCRRTVAAAVAVE